MQAIQDPALAAQAKQVKHDKEFKKGMEWFEQGYEAPKEASPVLAGWLAAQEMAEIKKKYLAASRNQFL